MTIIKDNKAEPSKTFKLTLSAATGAVPLGYHWRRGSTYLADTANIADSAEECGFLVPARAPVEVAGGTEKETTLYHDEKVSA